MTQEWIVRGVNYSFMVTEFWFLISASSCLTAHESKMVQCTWTGLNNEVSMTPILNCNYCQTRLVRPHLKSSDPLSLLVPSETIIAVYIDSLAIINIEKSETNKKKSTGNPRQICLRLWTGSRTGPVLSLWQKSSINFMVQDKFVSDFQCSVRFKTL